MLFHDGGICFLYTEEVNILFIRENRLIINAPIILTTLVRTLCYRIFTFNGIVIINEVMHAIDSVLEGNLSKKNCKLCTLKK